MFRASIETLEQRQFLSASLGTNLIVNGGAEEGAGTTDGSAVNIPGWTQTEQSGQVSVVQYGSGSFPGVGSPGPAVRGSNFFAGGPNSQSGLDQGIDISALSADIDAGRIRFTVDGYFGGFSTQEDFAQITIDFVDSDGVTQPGIVNGGVSPEERMNITGLLHQNFTDEVPIGTRVIFVTLTCAKIDAGSFNDGYADNISLVLNSSLGSKGQITGSVNNDANGNGKIDTGEQALGGITVFIDNNKNGILDKGEFSAGTSTNGRYLFTKVPAGTYNVVAIVPKTYRATRFDPVSVTVDAGLTTTKVNFPLSQTGVLGGTVFNDANANGKRDTNEVGIGFAVVFLDTNDNGKRDAGEVSAKTDSNGTYRFVVPFGTYVVRHFVPNGYKHFFPKSAKWTVTLDKGAFSKSNNFADVLV